MQFSSSIPLTLLLCTVFLSLHPFVDGSKAAIEKDIEVPEGGYADLTKVDMTKAQAFHGDLCKGGKEEGIKTNPGVMMAGENLIYPFNKATPPMAQKYRTELGTTVVDTNSELGCLFLYHDEDLPCSYEQCLWDRPATLQDEKSLVVSQKHGFYSLIKYRVEKKCPNTEKSVIYHFWYQKPDKIVSTTDEALKSWDGM